MTGIKCILSAYLLAYFLVFKRIFACIFHSFLGLNFRALIINLSMGFRINKLLKILGGSCGSSGKALGYGLDGPCSIPGVRGVEIFFTPSYPD